MCTCSREVNEMGIIEGGDTIGVFLLTDSDVNTACQTLCCQTPDCAGGDVQGTQCLLKKNAIDNVRIEPSNHNSAFLC